MRDKARLEAALRDLRTLMRRHSDATAYLPLARKIKAAIQALEDEERELLELLGGDLPA